MDEMLRSVSSEQITEWYAYFALRDEQAARVEEVRSEAAKAKKRASDANTGA